MKFQITHSETLIIQKTGGFLINKRQNREFHAQIFNTLKLTLNVHFRGGLLFLYLFI